MSQLSKSKVAYQEAIQLMPGGVNSPVRSCQAVGLSPVFIEHGQGSRINDIDGKEYIDYVLSWGPLILGHAHKQVVGKLKEVIEKGTSFGAPTIAENMLAQLIIDRVPSIDMVRMVNSGTEATMSAIRIARGYTGRDIILKFEGNYHGHSDSLLIKVGSGVATLGLPDSPGVPKSVAENTVIVPYNDRESVRQAFHQYGKNIAAIIVEPVSGNMGIIPPAKGFLQELRAITKENGSLLIFDEVMTGFRVGYDCAQGFYKVIPDLTCLGKVIGGGLPVGAYGGKKEIMEHVAPAGPIYQAGTLSGNPLAMTAGYETLCLLDQSAYDVMNRRVDQLVAGYRDVADKYKIPLQINRVGSMVSFFFSEQSVTNYDTAQRSNSERFTAYYKGMLREGIYLPPSPFEGLFMSTAHTEEDINQTISAVEKVFASLK
ncbi:glutamate-1-semialdehyde 2,1-aminomutase [Amphibacillus sp. MSJ-3]|uniref:glutamate-1-semialdehyde 2,1-aminomutase n=1 Tax=Amphibacillus sp. MSJ-3 TaxID=2841505 RepID=UPI001C0EBA3A|nr:glutamate-1-semialdehyde 2,1-aminomutase [Amphibacillus sp. MSJ-3]MBU5595305.1 glutamate-1-semialdehyde 2,1-aminomutase [Amphibacillus sp. MSJ-3]